MNGSETVAQDIFCVYCIHVVNILRKMTLWGVIAEYILDCIPDSSTRIQNTELDIVQTFSVVHHFTRQLLKT